MSATTESIVLTEAQITCLSKISETGKGPAASFDKRSINALSKKDLVKVAATKKNGDVVCLTAKGKKAMASIKEQGCDKN